MDNIWRTVMNLVNFILPGPKLVGCLTGTNCRQIDKWTQIIPSSALSQVRATNSKHSFTDWLLRRLARLEPIVCTDYLPSHQHICLLVYVPVQTCVVNSGQEVWGVAHLSLLILLEAMGGTNSIGSSPNLFSYHEELDRTGGFFPRVVAFHLIVLYRMKCSGDYRRLGRLL